MDASGARSLGGYRTPSFAGDHAEEPDARARSDRPGRSADIMCAALRSLKASKLPRMVDEKSNEIPAAPELIEALGLKNCVFTLDAEHAQKNRSSA